MDRWLESCIIMALKKDISGGEPTHMASVCSLYYAGGRSRARRQRVQYPLGGKLLLRQALKQSEIKLRAPNIPLQVDNCQDGGTRASSTAPPPLATC